jgi:hypothetical protein
MTSASPMRINVGTSRFQVNGSCTGAIPGRGWELPAGASATTAPIRGSTSGVASAVQPPRLVHYQTDSGAVDGQFGVAGEHVQREA